VLTTDWLALARKLEDLEATLFLNGLSSVRARIKEIVPEYSDVSENDSNPDEDEETWAQRATARRYLCKPKTLTAWLRDIASIWDIRESSAVIGPILTHGRVQMACVAPFGSVRNSSASYSAWRTTSSGLSLRFARCFSTKGSRPTSKEGPKFIQRLIAKQKARIKES